MDAKRRLLVTALSASAGFGKKALADPPPPWGTIPTYTTPIWNTPRDLKILEIHLYGGMSMWETFYVRPPGATERFRGFDAEMGMLPFAGCDAAFTDPDPGALGNDARGRPVHLGPATKPLWATGILNKLRVVVVKHEFDPHEVAIPLMLTGFGLGKPKLAGLGAAVQHAYYDRSVAAGTPATQPFSYVLWPETFNFPNDNLQASAAIGTHPGYSRPLVIKIGASTSAFLSGLSRSGIRSERDALLKQYTGEYRAQLRHRSLTPPERNRSRGFTSFDASMDAVAGAANLSTLLSSPSSPLGSALPLEAVCPGFLSGNFENMPAQAIRVAGYLLSQTGSNAPRYVCVVDKGHNSHPMGGGYDTHSSDHISFTNFNLFNICRTLRQLIDSGTLNLANTMIVLTTEFGRTPTRGGSGRDHWPKGFCQVLIGGPVRRGVSGAILDRNQLGVMPSQDGHADPNNHFGPADARAAILLAAGIYPFSEQELFNVSDMSFYTAGSTPETLMRTLKTNVLGALAGD